MNSIRQFWKNLRSSFWFLPTCLVVAAAILGIILVEVDSHIETDLGETFPKLFAVGAEGAQGILQSIATSMITVAGVTFSITILILNEASNQYSPRILRNFVRDRSNQFVLGAFLAIFVYCLVVLRSIHDIEEEKFVPPIAVLGGIALALVGIGVLIFFIHHIAYSIQASTIIQRVAKETLKEINQLYPENLGVGPDEHASNVAGKIQLEKNWHPIKAPRSGYLSGTNPEKLLQFAEDHDTVVRIEADIGEFIIEDTRFASVYGNDRPSNQAEKTLLQSISISSYRTIDQDAAFGIRQLADIALKALSPSMNDTTTANMCIDHLTVLLARLIQRKMESPYRFKDGKLRVIVARPTFEKLLEDCLEQIRHNARGNIRVLQQLMHTIRTVSPLTACSSRLRALMQQLELVIEAVETTISSKADRDRLLHQGKALQHTLYPKTVPEHQPPPE